MTRVLCALLLLIFLGIPTQTEAAIAWGTAVVCNNAGAGTTTMTCSSVVVSGSDRVLYCAVLANSTTNINPAAAFNTSETMTLIKESTTTGIYLGVFRLVAPTATTANVSFSSLSASVTEAGACIPGTGIDQGTPNDTEDLQEQGAVDMAISSATITSPSGDEIFGCVSITGGSQTPTASAGGSGAANFTNSPVNGDVADLRCAHDPDGVDDTLDWTWTAVNSEASAITFNVNAAGGGGGTGRPSVIGGGVF